MDSREFIPLKETINNMAIQLITFLLITALGYIISYVVLKIIKVPEKIAHVISVIIFLIVAYFSFMGVIGENSHVLEGVIYNHW